MMYVDKSYFSKENIHTKKEIYILFYKIITNHRNQQRKMSNSY